MRKTLFLTSVLACVLLTGCEEETQQNEVFPELTVGVSGNISISRDGGPLSIPYTVTDPAEDGEISARTECDWIKDFSYESGEVTAMVDENTLTENRSAIVTLEYFYDGGGKSVDAQVNVIQEAAIAYDYSLEASEFQGHYYGTRYGKNGEYNYYTWISDLPFDEYGRTQVGGTYYLFDLYAAAPEDAENPLPPAGTYTLGETGSTAEMTFSREYSKVRATDTEGNITLSTYFSEGTLTLSYEDGLMVIDARLTDIEGKYHHVTYSHQTPTYLIGDGGIGAEGYLTLERDLNIEPTIITASYYRDEGNGVMDVMLRFADAEYEDEEMTEPGSALFIEAYMPYDENGYIATGTYRITEDEGAAFTMPAGEMTVLLSYLFPYENFAVYSDDGETQHYGFCKEGTMTVTGGNGNYEIVCDFTTADGHTVTCRYSGELLVENVPKPLSTLEGDYTLDLSRTEATASYLGDYYYNNGGYWQIILEPSDGVTGDGFMTTLVGESTDFSQGIPSDSYEVSVSTYYVFPGCYLPGYVSGESLNGTMYLGGYMEDGTVTKYAPAVSGDLDVENHGDGSYTLSFKFMDDRGYTWDGTWTGPVATNDLTSQTSGRSLQSVPFSGYPVRTFISPVSKKDRKGIAPMAGTSVLTSAKR